MPSQPATSSSPSVASTWNRFIDRRWVLALILLLAFALRAWNLDWDRGTHLQPDERFWSSVAAQTQNPEDWSDALDPEKSTLNPRFHEGIPHYVYGTMPLWASEAAAGVLMTDTMSWAVAGIDGVGIDVANNEPADLPVTERLRFNTGYDVTIIGRLMSALIDTATVGAVFLLARELTDNRRIGLLAALLQALTVLHIQYSHFLGSEPWVALFVTCAVFGSVRLARGRGGWRTRAGTAIAVGLAIASKLSGIASVAAPLAAALILIGPDMGNLIQRRIAPGVVSRVARKVEPFLVMGLLAVVAYRIAQPYDFRAGLSLVLNDRFSNDIEYLSDINNGGNWPWVQPLVGRTRLLHPLKQMVLWGMGPGLGIAGFLGIARALRRFTLGERYWAVPLAVIGSYFALVSLQFYAIIRYLQPTYPIITTLGAIGLVAALRRATELAPDRQRLAQVIRVAVGLAIGITVFWALAFVNGVYNNTNARLAAGDWMIENLPADAAVSSQEWDDGLPWGRPSTFEFVTFRPFSFGGDTPEHIELLINGLHEVDYVIETSNKFYDALPRTPARFPQTSRYYETLFDGSLGFELIETFQNQPSLFGITIDDSSAEEAFTLYDHPTVFIWQKTDSFSVDRAYALLNPERARTAVNAIPRDAFANASMLPPDEYASQQQGSSFRDVHSNEPNSVVAAFMWFGLLQVVSLTLVPVLLPRAGRAAGAVYGLTKPLAMVVFALPVWLLVSWGVVDMSRLLVGAMFLAMVVGGVVLARERADQLREIWTQHRRTILRAEAAFVGAFLIVLALRAGNPDVWHPWRGGEKPMELAYLTAVTGSTTMPPYDPWLAGGSLNYYYMGWFVLAVPIRLLSYAPDVGFNLGVATYAALAAVTVFSTSAMLAELARRRTDRALSPERTGLIAVVFFMVMGNLDGFRQLVNRLRNDLPLADFDWWDASRVNKASSGFEVTEFPTFTVLFGDLHPHFMAMPFFGLGLAGAIAFIERARQGRNDTAWLLAIGLGIGSGFMRMVHTWDLPTFGLMVAGAIVVGWTMARGPALWRVRIAMGQLMAVGIAHLFVTAPYRARNQVADSGFSRAESSTNLDDWLVHWGLFLFVAAFYLVSRLWRLRNELVRTPLLPAGALLFSVVGFVGFHRAVGSVTAWAFLALIGAWLVLNLEVLTQRASTPHVLVASAWTLGFAVLVGVEIFTQNADIERLNTVFKFWLQVWHLFAIAAAFGVSWLVGPLVHARQARASNPELAASQPASRPALRSVFAAGLALLLIAGLVYPVLSVRPRQANRFDAALGPSLDGQLWLEPGQHTINVRDFTGMDHPVDPGRDRPLIEWLQANADGRPTVVEAVGGAEYQWWGRISIHSGLPTVVGWRWHQDQQRTLFNFEVNERNADVANFYQTEDPASINAFLRAYDVTYVIVGSLETTTANPRTLQLFAENPELITVFDNGDVRIYEVAKESLAQTRGPIAAIGSG